MTPQFNATRTFSSDLANAVAVWEFYLPNAMKPWNVGGVFTPGTSRDDNICGFYINNSLPDQHPARAEIEMNLQTGEITEVDVDVKSNWPTYSHISPYTVLLHELGHFLGADSSDVSSAIMAHPYQLSYSWLTPDDTSFVYNHYKRSTGGGGRDTCISTCRSCCPDRFDPRIETYAEVFRLVIDSTLYAAGTPGEQWSDLAEANSDEALLALQSNPQLFFDATNFLIDNVSLAESQLTDSPEHLTRAQINGAAALLYRLADSSSAEMRDALFKIVAVLDQSEGKTFKQTIEDVLRGVTIPWNQIIQWLIQNYPNPFNPVTTIRYRVATPSYITLKVYDVIGREVTTLADGYHGRGIHQVQFDGANLASGVYFYRLVTPDRVETRKMLLTK